MAAITYWVDPVGGNDAATGKSYADRVQTVPQVITNIAADGANNDFTVNLLNTADYPTVASRFDVDTGSSTCSYHFRGVSDSSATPAQVRVLDDTTGTTDQYFIFITGSTSLLVENIKFEATGSGLAHDFYCVGYSGSFTKNQVYQYCHVKGGEAAEGKRLPASVWLGYPLNSGTSAQIEARYCIWENTTDGNIFPTSWWIAESLIHDNVFVFDDGFASSWTRISPMAVGNWSSGWVHKFYNNTFYSKSHAATASVVGLCQYSEFTDTNIDFEYYNNVIYCDTPNSNVDVGTEVLSGSNSSATSSFLAGNQIGYNTYLFEARTPTLDITNIYDPDPPWSPDTNDGTYDLYTGDSVDEEIDETAWFNDVSSSYEWTPEGSSISMTVAKDLRLLQGTTGGTESSVPGALPAAFVDPGIVGTTISPTSIVEGDSLTVTFTYTEDATDNTDGTTVSLSYPAGLTLHSTKVSLGSFASDVWTLSGTSVGGTATLTATFMVASVAAGEELGVTATITAHGSGTALGGTTANDTDTVTFTGLSIEGGVTDPDSPDRVPVLDVIPAVEPLLELDVNTRFSTSRNRGQEIYQRYDEEGVLFSEYRGAVINLATNTSLVLNMGGVERGSYMLYDTDNAIQVSLNGASFLPESKQMALSRGAFTSVKLKNNSTTNAAEVFVVVVD